MTEGTLIGLLRYGRNVSPVSGRSVDHDIDIMVEVEDEVAWGRIAAQLMADLRSRGWYDLRLQTTSRTPGARLDKVRGWIRGAGFARTRCDVHSYFVVGDGTVAVSHGDLTSYPFQRWSGRMPISLVHPLGAVRCYERDAPAPRAPIAVLRDWNDGEYTHRCLAFPRRNISAAERGAILGIAHELDAAGYLSMRPELERCNQWSQPLAPPRSLGPGSTRSQSAPAARRVR